MSPIRMVRPCLVAILIGVPLTLVLAAPPETTGPRLPINDFSKSTAYKVVRVIDGDY